MENRVVSRGEWQAARDELLKEEQEHARRSEELAQKRRALPWVRLDKDYTLQSDDGPKTLAELFDGRSQLLAYNIMFGPDYEAACPGCSNLADSFDSLVVHLHHRDVTFLAFSRAPIEALQRYKARMDWKFTWVSTHGSAFAYDFGLANSPEAMAQGELSKLVHEPPPFLSEWARSVGTGLERGLQENPGWVVFAQRDGAVYHTYTCMAPDRDRVVPYFQQLQDMTPQGRGEDLSAWRKDEYP